MTARPFVSIQLHDATKSKSKTAHISLPSVFSAPIRLDVVRSTYTNVAKNRRQPYAVSQRAGHQTSAESWGTGRAVARIPRVAGGGTHRAGQGAFGNMCRGGRLFQPTKTWRRWHRLTNLNQRRFAIASALAASALVPLVLARGHRIEQVDEIPLVVANEAFTGVNGTKEAVAILKKLKAFEDVEKVKDSHKIKAGKGKSRNRRYTQRRGPLVVFEKKSWGAHSSRSFRNISGVELISVDALSLLLLAPGGHVGRFVIWTSEAFAKVDKLWGTYSKGALLKKGYHLPRSIISSSDIGRIINSDEVQSVLRPAQTSRQRKERRRPNPLKNVATMIKLNPYYEILKKRRIVASQKVVTPEQKKKNEDARKLKKKNQIKTNKAVAKRRSAFYKLLLS